MAKSETKPAALVVGVGPGLGQPWFGALPPAKAWGWPSPRLSTS
jgi:hypothetical protein